MQPLWRGGSGALRPHESASERIKAHDPIIMMDVVVAAAAQPTALRECLACASTLRKKPFKRIHPCFAPAPLGQLWLNSGQCSRNRRCPASLSSRRSASVCGPPYRVALLSETDSRDGYAMWAQASQVRGPCLNCRSRKVQLAIVSLNLSLTYRIGLRIYQHQGTVPR